MTFSVQHASEAQFKYDGLRKYFEYRDLGIHQATEGHAIMRWAIFEYEGHGQHRLEAGSCVHQPSGIRHREIAHSDDVEILEIVLPGDFETVVVDAPPKT